MVLPLLHLRRVVRIPRRSRCGHLAASPFVQCGTHLLAEHIQGCVNRRNGRCLSQHRDGDDLALRETGDGNLVQLLQLLDEGADSGAVPMPASCQFGNGDYKLPVGQAVSCLHKSLGMYCTEALFYKVKVGFELRQPYPGPLFQRTPTGTSVQTSCRNSFYVSVSSFQ